MLPMLLLFHILAVTMLFSGMTLEIVGFGRLHRATTLAEARAATVNFPLVSPLMGLGALLLIIAGVAMVYVTGFGWTPAWISVTALMTLILTISGPLVNGRRGERIFRLALSGGEGPITSQLRRARNDALLNYSIFLSGFELVAGLFMMTIKPQLPACIIAALLAAALAVIPTAFVLRRGALASAR